MTPTRMDAAVDALVVGAGPVGLTMAAALARYGVSCRLIEKCAAPSDKSKALVLWSRSLEMLDKVGAAAPFVAAGLRAHGASIYSGGERLVRVSLEIDSPYNYALMIPQTETERLLAELARQFGIAAERQIELTGFIPDADGVTSTLRLADGKSAQVRSAWLVGCDGAHSTVRHLLDVPFTGEAELNDWMLADIHVKGALPTDELSIYFHRDGLLAFFPIVGGRFRIIADQGTAKDVGRPADPSLTDVQRLVDDRGPGGLTITDPVWLAGFRIHERMVSQYRRGRVFLAGDAAHIHSPAGGQGMNTGMQDACNLAWKLALVQQGRATDLLLDSYSQERGKVGEQVLRNAGIMTTAATLRNPLAQHFRDRLYRLFGSLPIVQHAISGTLAELSVNYRHGPITGEHHSAFVHSWLLGGGVASGDRAPDVLLVDATSGKELQLFDLFRGTGHVLLLIAGVDAAADVAPLAKIQAAVNARYPGLVTSHVIASQHVPGATLIDSDLALHKRYGAGARTLYLIRPDGYVGFRGQPAEGDALIAHLAKYLR